MGLEDPSEESFRQIKSDLIRNRRSRLADLAKARHLISPTQWHALWDSESVSDRDLVDRGWISEEQYVELRREVDTGSMSAPSSPLLARYEVQEKLGEGAMSRVFRALDRQLHRPVAIKILKESLLFQDSVRRRFCREAQTLARMDHPNVVRVYDSGESGTQMYIAMELVEGEALSSMIARKALDLRGFLGLLEQAARGIDHAHRKGIIHRDIKPQNILVTKSGELKVADFGLAHLLESDPGLTGIGTVLGTPLYMAPEQVAGGGSLITHRTDVYALGAILYELLTGWPPHRGDSISEIYGMILRKNPLPPHLVASRVPPELEVIALKAIEKDPSHRYSSAGEFAEDLRRYLAGEPIQARPVSGVTRFARWAAKRQAILWPIVAAGVLLMLGASLWIQRQRELDREKERILERQKAAESRTESARVFLAKASQEQYSRAPSIQNYFKRLGEAGGFIDQALELDPDSAPVHYLRGEVQILKGHYEEAERSLRRSVALNPRFGPAHFRLGQVLLWQAFLFNLEMWKDPKGLRLAQSASQAREGEREFQVAQADADGFDSELQREVAVAMLAYIQNKPESVREICQRGIERFGAKEGAEEFYWLLGLLPGTQAQSIEILDKAIEIKPLFPLALYSRAFAWMNGHNHPRHPSGSLDGCLKKALDDFNQATLIQPDFPEAYIFRGGLLLQQKDVQGGVADFDKAIALGRRSAAAYNGRAFARIQHLNDLDGAIADCNQAIRLEPENFPMPYFNRAVAYYRKKDYDAALRDADKMIAIGWAAGTKEMQQLRAKCFDARGDASGLLGALREMLPPTASAEDLDRGALDIHKERLKDEGERP